MISVAGEGAGVLLQLQQEGNNVELLIQEKTYNTVYDGLLPKVNKIDPDDDTIIIFDMSGNGDQADELRKLGYRVFGSSRFSDQLEKDREFGLEIMREVGIKLPETEEFQDFGDAYSFLDENEHKRFVFKPSGSMPCKLTYCSKDNEDLITYMKFVEEKFSDEIDSFVLQEFVEGDLVSTEIYFDGNKQVGCPNHTVEVKKFMNNDLGPSTGCSGNIVWLADNDKVVKAGVGKVAKILKDYNFGAGQIDLNAVVNDKGLFGLEWTPRFGYDSMPIYLQMINMEYGKFFADITDGKIKYWDHKYDSLSSVRFTIPPYPAEPEGDPEELSPSTGIPIRGWETFDKNLYLFEVMMQEDQLVHSGGTGVIGLAYAEKIKRCYEVIKQLNIPDIQYRTDLEKVLECMKKDARKWE